jgi:putative selenate reductase molybdopterin-binding subunit
MELELCINGTIESVQVPVNESLLTMLRRQGYYSVKQGCETGECGACVVLVDGVPRPSCIMLAGQAGGCALTTVEGLGSSKTLHPLQEAFIEVGAVQCGFCTPGMLLSAYALLLRNAHPTESEVRDVLSGHLCCCTGYAKPIQAIMRAAARMRGVHVPALEYHATVRKTVKATEKLRAVSPNVVAKETIRLRAINANAATTLLAEPEVQYQVVGKAVQATDALKFVTGKPAFAGDSAPQGMLYGCILTSPHAHAVIRAIDVSQAKALPGVHAVLTYKDVPHVAHSIVERFPPDSGPADYYCLDSIMRYVGDRVAAVAAETPEVAEQALRLIQVEYDVLPAILDPRRALELSAPPLHPESESRGIVDAAHNIAARVRIGVGDVERGFAQADMVIDGQYIVPQVQQIALEKHTVITYFDENDYLVVRTDAPALQHIRRTISSLLALPARRIRIVKADSSANANNKQQIMLEALCALLTEATHRPVKLTYSHADEFVSGLRHTHVLHLKTGVRRDGTIVANQMALIASTGAYATHPLTSPCSSYFPALSLYPCPNMRYIAEILYTNLPPSGTAHSYSMPQEFFALECHMDEIAKQLGMDALEIRRRNWFQAGDTHLLVREARGEQFSTESCGLPECLRTVAEKLNWRERRRSAERSVSRGYERFRRGVGVALALEGSMATSTNGASIKLNDDGSFDLFTAACDSGFTTILAQVASEALGVPLEDILLHPVDTSNTLCDTNTHVAPYSAIGAVKRVAEQMRRQILAVAARMFDTLPNTLRLAAGIITSSTEQVTTVAQVSAHALYVEGQHLVVTTSWKAQQTPTSFAAQGAEVEVDTETGSVRILKVITAVDGGRFINPLLAEGQIQGSTTQALSASICEELIYDQNGVLLTAGLSDYHIYNAQDMPEIQTCLVETEDTSVPFGAKVFTTVPQNAIAPAVANAVADALGIRIRQLPLTPEHVLHALHAQKK